jgi:hypothetical protein
MRLAIVHTPPGNRAGNDFSNPGAVERNVPLGRVTGLPGEGTSGLRRVFNACDEPQVGRILDGIQKSELKSDSFVPRHRQSPWMVKAAQ